MIFGPAVHVAAPGEEDLFVFNQLEIHAMEFSATGGELPANLAADRGRIARKRGVFLRVHERFVDCVRSRFERHGLFDCFCGHKSVLMIYTGGRFPDEAQERALHSSRQNPLDQDCP